MGPLAAALTVDVAPGSPAFVYGNTVTVNTDATSGTLAILAPYQDDDCVLQVDSRSVALDGPNVGGLVLSRAGQWTIVNHPSGQSDTFEVAPKPLSVIVTAVSSGSPGRFNYDIQVLNSDSSPAFGAYVDLALSNDPNVPLRHLQTDSSGRLTVSHLLLPFAGSYKVHAYKDADSPLATYPVGFVYQASPVCNPSAPYDPPEFSNAQQTTGATISKMTETLQISVHPDATGNRPYPGQSRNVPGAVSLDVEASTSAPLSFDVELYQNGVVASPASLGLTLTKNTISPTKAGNFTLSGLWNSASDVRALVKVHRNSATDSTPEYQGEFTVPVLQDVPVTVHPCTGTQLQYTVPAPQGNGAPGQYDLCFQLRDSENNLGTPPAVSPRDFTISGDILPGAQAVYDGSTSRWHVYVTPKNSDSNIDIRVVWTGEGSTTIRVDLPREGGAKTTIVQPVADGHGNGKLTVGDAQDLKVKVQLYNRDAVERNLCSPLPNCAYEVVTDARVWLVYADNGEPLYTTPENALDPSVQYLYQPGAAPNGCQCFQFEGTYHFLNVIVPQGRDVVAIARIDPPASGQPHRYSYAFFDTVPRPSLTPDFTPTIDLAGEYTVHEITGVAGLSYDTFSRGGYAVTVKDPQGHDVTTQGAFDGNTQKLTWAAALPVGQYTLSVEELYKPAMGIFGEDGTGEQGVLEVKPAQVRFKHLDATTYTSIVGDLNQPLTQNYLPVRLKENDEVKGVAITVTHPRTNQNVAGTLTLSGATPQGLAVADMRYKAPTEPVQLSSPQLFGPDALWISQLGRSYYIVEFNHPETFTSSLELRTTSGAVEMYVMGLQVGDVTGTFKSSSSSLNTVQATTGRLSVLPPAITVLSVGTDKGTVPGNNLAVGEDNVVSFRLDDSTGFYDTAGVKFGLQRSLLGPSQVPGGTAGVANTQGTSDATLAIIPDATGDMTWVAEYKQSLVKLGTTVQVNHVTQFLHTNGELLIDSPPTTISGSLFTVRVSATDDPYPGYGTVEFNGDNLTLVNGQRTLVAPSVPNGQQEFLLPIKAFVTGYPVKVASIKVTPNSLASPTLQVAGLQGPYNEAQKVQFTVTSAGKPVAGVTASLLDQTGVSNTNGVLNITMPRVDQNTTGPALTFAKDGFQTFSRTPTIVDVAKPKVKVAAPNNITGGQVGTIEVSVLDELNRAAFVPTTLHLTVGSLTLTPTFSGTKATAQYTAPRLQVDVPVFAIAKAPGMTDGSAKILIKEAI
jgi:hypothetical protein